PVTPVLRVSAQVLPGKSMLIKVQKVEIGRGGTPLLGVAMSHRPTSLLRDSRPWLATEKRRPLCEADNAGAPADNAGAPAEPSVRDATQGRAVLSHPASLGGQK